MELWLVDLLDMESLLPVGLGQQIHSLPSIFDRMRMMAITSAQKTAMQTDNIVGQWVLPICGLKIPGIPVAEIQSSLMRALWFLILSLRNPRMFSPTLFLARMENRFVCRFSLSTSVSSS